MRATSHPKCPILRDWKDDWVFYDRRFNFLYAPDDQFLRFLCETVAGEELRLNQKSLSAIE